MSRGPTRRLFLAAPFGIALASTATAPGQALTQDETDLAKLISRGKLRVVVPSFESPPFFYRRDGTPAGIDIDLASAMATALGVELELDRRPASFNDAVDVIIRGEADLAVCKLSRTLNRARVIRYSQPYARLSHGLIANRVRFAALLGTRKIETVIRKFDGRMGVIAKSSFAEFARRNFPNAKLVEFASWGHVLDGVRSGDVDAAYRDEFEIKRVLLDDPSLTLVARSVTLTDLTDTIGIGIAPGASHLAAYVDTFLALTDRSNALSADEILRHYKLAEKPA
ncbi:substrate-binding periplasmic protein [Prosthecodimorpha staleyi]|nr:transporter substrate-binding domain-containing protein [Prosthecodimorpha staleyi]MBT9292300.1 transporter substrate-binding domain-containing protein [Prosthecodimorpha staleyi]